MDKKFVLVVLFLSPLLVIVFGVGSSVPAAASPLIVRVPDDYQTIQEAVDAASPEDIILVAAETYFEHVIVNKALSLIGEGANSIIDGNGTGKVISVTSDNVYISGFTIQNGRNPGIWLNSDYNTIQGNTITKNIFDGLVANHSNHNRIIQNKISHNGDGPPDLRWGSGITLMYSNGNIISNNSISNNALGGIDLSSSHDNIVNHNTLKNNSVSVDLSSSVGNIVSDNLMTSNGNGVSIEVSTENTIEHNQILKNDIGIGIGYSSTNVIKENNISENTIHGIAIAETSTNITVVGNTISKNRNGIKIHYSNGSVIHHNNLINNTKSAPEDVYPNVNTWDDDYPSGGNYWSNYTGVDSDHDGIGDTPHTLDARNRDNFPLMGPISFFEAGTWSGTSCDIHVISNSTISNFRLNKTQKTISFNVTGPDHTTGFCRITTPNIIVQDLWQNNYTILIDGKQPLTTRNWTEGTCTYIHFTYLHSEHKIIIIPEFLAIIILPLFMTITLCTVISRRRKIRPQF